VTHSLPALLPLAVACVASHLVTALVMPRSILTERLSRRGNHLTREYGVDPLELVLVRDVMSPLALVVSNIPFSKVFVYADSTTRGAAGIMATEGLETISVVDRTTGLVCGELSLKDLLRGRARSLGRESERLRLFGMFRPRFVVTTMLSQSAIQQLQSKRRVSGRMSGQCLFSCWLVPGKSWFFTAGARPDLSTAWNRSGQSQVKSCAATGGGLSPQPPAMRLND
jgi:hypothetical protein